MATETVEALVAGGKASAGPPLGPALGPMGVNISQVIGAINEKTKDFQGMQVPITVTINMDDKSFEISVGTPPAASLILKEAGAAKGAGNPLADKVADLRIEQIIKIAKMKEDALLGKNMKSMVKEIIGTCNSMGILVQGSSGRDAIARVNAGEFDEKITAEKTELSAEEKAELEEERKKLQEEMAERLQKLESAAKDIVIQNKNKSEGAIKALLKAADIPEHLQNKVMAEEGIGTDAAAPAAK